MIFFIFEIWKIYFSITIPEDETETSYTCNYAWTMLYLEDCTGNQILYQIYLLTPLLLVSKSVDNGGGTLLDQWLSQTISEKVTIVTIKDRTHADRMPVQH